MASGRLCIGSYTPDIIVFDNSVTSEDYAIKEKPESDKEFDWENY